MSGTMWVRTSGSADLRSGARTPQLLYLLSTGLCSILLLVACTTGPPGAGGTPGPVVPGDPDGAGTTQEQLCDAQNPAGLAMVADALDGIDENTDVTQLNTSVNAVLTNLALIQVDALTAERRAAVAAAADAFQQTLADPTSRRETAAALAQALRDVESTICM